LTDAAPAHAVITCHISSDPGCPLPVDDYYTVPYRSGTFVAAPGLLANDYGPNGTRVSVADSDTQSFAGAGLVIFQDDSFSCTYPDEPFSGLDNSATRSPIGTADSRPQPS
jgi:hypothetical protein